MSESDVLPAIQRWLDADFVLPGDSPTAETLLWRARDEIVALRQAEMEAKSAAMLAYAEGRNARVDALEEAAQECEAVAESFSYQEHAALDGCDKCATAIRALKDNDQ